jgi:hypothetical protein
MEWDDINDPDGLKAWAKEKAASPAAEQAFWNCMHHLVNQIETVINDSVLEHPMGMVRGTAEITMKDGEVILGYLVSFELFDTKEEFDYVFVMLMGTDQYTDVKYLDPAIVSSRNQMQ